MSFENLYDTQTMLDVIDETQAFKPKNHLTRTFFPVGKDIEGEILIVDIIKGARRIAPMIHPGQRAEKVEKRPYRSNKVSPGYIRILDAVTAADSLTRRPGETIYRPGVSALQVATERLAETLADFIDMIMRRIEVMSREALITGKVTIIDEDASTEDILDFQRDAGNDITLTGTDLWTDTVNSDPTEDILDWKRMISEKTGLTANRIYLGHTALKAYLKHPRVLEYYNIRRMDLGSAIREEEEEGVTSYGVVHGVRVYSYDEWYLNLTGTSTPMIPDTDVLMGVTNSRNRLHYGAIRDPNAGVVAVPFWPASWVENNPGARFLKVESAPLCALHQPDTTMRAKVVA